MLILAWIIVLLFPVTSHAAVYWDDEMETGSVLGSDSHLTTVLIPAGAYAIDTNVKFSGTGSIRQNFPAICQSTSSSGTQCGGAITRTFTPTDDSWMRWYIRISGDTSQGATIGSPGGSFQAYSSAFTKFVQGQSTHSPGAQNYARYWFSMGCCSVTGKTFVLGAERVPDPNNAQNYYSSKVLSDNTWYCIETHTQMNTPGVANGIAEAWVDGVLVLSRTTIPWRNTGTDANAKWEQWSTVRQGGVGNIWYDRVVVGDARIGCIGAPPVSDTTPPTAPSSLVAQ